MFSHCYRLKYGPVRLILAVASKIMYLVVLPIAFVVFCTILNKAWQIA